MVERTQAAAMTHLVCPSRRYRSRPLVTWVKIWGVGFGVWGLGSEV